MNFYKSVIMNFVFAQAKYIMQETSEWTVIILSNLCKSKVGCAPPLLYEPVVEPYSLEISVFCRFRYAEDVPVVAHHRLHVISRAEGDQVGVVGRRRDGHGSRASDVGVTQLVGEVLQHVGLVVVVVVQHVVVRWPRRAL